MYNKYVGVRTMKRIITIFLAIYMLSSCASNQPVATVGNTKITEGEFNFYLSSIKQQMQDTEIQTDEDWETKEIEGKKAIDVAKQKAIDQAIKNAEYCEIGKKAGIKLTEEDRKKTELTKQRVVSSYGGEKAYKAFLKSNNITDKFIDMMCSSTIYHAKLADMLAEENPITYEQCREYYENNKSDFETEYRKAKHILILTVDANTEQPKSDEEKTEAKKKAENIYDSAKKGEDFDSLMKTYSEDPGLKKNPGGYVFTSGQMLPEFEKAVDRIKPDELTFAETEYGYHIIKRLPLEYPDIESNVKSKLVEICLAEKLPEWEMKYNIKITKNDIKISGAKQ